MSEETNELELEDVIFDAHVLEQQRDYLLDLIYRIGGVMRDEEITPLHPFFVELSRMIKEGMLYQEGHKYKKLVTFEALEGIRE